MKACEELDNRNETPTELSDEYQTLLAEANATDFSDLERSQVLQTGLNSSGDHVLIFLPKLGFHVSRDSNSQLRKMLLFFIKKAHHIVSHPYIFVYDHMQFSIFTQHPVIFRMYSMLPREYKKNISKLYVVHPTFLIRMFFEQGVKHFVSQKFYEKLSFLDSVLDLQPLIMPLGGSLPTAFLKRGDGKTTPPKSQFDPTHMPPLAASFNPDLGTTVIIHQCTTYLSAEDRLKTKGLFRLAGDQAVLDLVRVRNFGRLNDPPLVIIGAAAYESIAPHPPTKGQFSSTKTAAFSTVVVTDIHTVTSIMTQSLRYLPESLIVPKVHKSLLQLTKNLEKENSVEEWHRSVTPLLNSMPECHFRTLNHLLRFLARVTMESSVNGMTVENIARVFAPTLFPETPLDSANPMLAFAEVQLQKVILTHLITKHMQEEDTLVSNINLSSKMIGRCSRTSVSDDGDEDDDTDNGDDDRVAPDVGNHLADDEPNPPQENQNVEAL